VEGTLFSNVPERLFVACMLAFLAAMTLVTLSQHFALLWVAVEATTLFSAPLIYFHRHHRSLEAAWKYLLIASVGIALALLGTFLLAIASQGAGLGLDQMLNSTLSAQPGWLKAAFILLLVGYGTKMGLAPLHTWLPDAHSEAPSLVSALMSGALLNCAFLGILRAYQVLASAGLQPFAQGLLLLMGLLSMAVAAVFIIRQTDYKRMLAYSSVEHMGILAVGISAGGPAVFGAMLHAVNHSVAKGLLFFVAGNALALYHSTGMRQVRGMLRSLPISGPLWIAGLFAVTGSPPFGAFISEFTILQGTFARQGFLVTSLFLGCLVAAFCGMASAVLKMAQGVEPWEPSRPRREALLAVAPPLALAAVALLLGVYLPPDLERLLEGASQLLGGSFTGGRP
jgi:hydrogenase-4 component F